MIVSGQRQLISSSAGTFSCDLDIVDAVGGRAPYNGRLAPAIAVIVHGNFVATASYTRSTVSFSEPNEIPIRYSASLAALKLNQSRSPGVLIDAAIDE